VYSVKVLKVSLYILTSLKLTGSRVVVAVIVVEGTVTTIEDADALVSMKVTVVDVTLREL
jgi:intracellular septation protein A